MKRWTFVIECKKEDGLPRRQKTWRMAANADDAKKVLLNDIQNRVFGGIAVRIVSGPTEA